LLRRGGDRPRGRLRRRLIQLSGLTLATTGRLLSSGIHLLWDRVHMHVLVVEDGGKMAALIRRGLSEQGLTVDFAGTGEDAVGMARASAYDAVVLDVILPGIDGFETCRRLRLEGIWSPVL